MNKPLFLPRTLRKIQYYLNCSVYLSVTRKQNRNLAKSVGTVRGVGVNNVLLQGRTGVNKLLLPSRRNQVNELRLTKRAV